MNDVTPYLILILIQQRDRETREPKKKKKKKFDPETPGVPESRGERGRVRGESRLLLLRRKPRQLAYTAHLRLPNIPPCKFFSLHLFFTPPPHPSIPSIHPGREITVLLIKNRKAVCAVRATCCCCCRLRLRDARCADASMSPPLSPLTPSDSAGSE
jgi:hypothetical protein